MLSKAKRIPLFAASLLLVHALLYLSIRFFFVHPSESTEQSACILLIGSSLLLWLTMYLTCRLLAGKAEVKTIRSVMNLFAFSWAFAIGLLVYAKLYCETSVLPLWEREKYTLHLLASYGLARFVTERCFCRRAEADTI